jgi:polysaccharide pyruvyl transferase WcaK-like protein
MSRPRFLLFGILGCYNYGCEAIVRGTEVILRSRWSDCEISYASFQPEQDRKRLEGSRVNVVNAVWPTRFSLDNLNRKFHELSGRIYPPVLPLIDGIDACDALLLIGGDMFLADATGHVPSRYLQAAGRQALRHGALAVIWAASVSLRNTDSDEARELLHFLGQASLITSRESQSTADLERHGVSASVEPVADPAFLVSGGEDARPPGADQPLRIALNLSPLSAQAQTGDPGGLLDRQAAAIAAIVREFQAEVLLVPHVIPEANPSDDDRAYLRSLHDRLSAEAKTKTELIASDTGFLETKRLLASCHLVFAARMHCAINAASAGVPTVLLAYSEKAFGMARYLYGDQLQAMPVDRFEAAQVIAEIRKLLPRLPEIGALLEHRIPQARQQALAGAQALAARLEERSPDASALAAAASTSAHAK